MGNSKLLVFDPPEHIAEGTGESTVDLETVRFPGNLDWLEKQGFEVERYNLSSNPGEFERHDCVKDALAKEGDGCLPLIVLDGEIVSRGRYPSRDELAKISGLVVDSAENETQAPAADPGPPAEEEPPQCLSGCSFSAKSAGVGSKVLIVLTVLVLASGALAYYKVSGGGGSSESQPAANVQTMEDGRSANTPPAGNAVNATPVETPGGFGPVLSSINDLNNVAMDKDGVFIFIPGSDNAKAGADTIAAANSAKKMFDRSKIAVGFFTLSTESAEYEGISRQVTAPAVLILCKGRGTIAVKGEVTEAKLTQAFVAASNAGGGCGPTCKPSP